MKQYVLYFSEINKSSLLLVGEKGANLGKLCHVPGINVPTGFCISTKAYAEFVNTSKEFAVLLKSLESVNLESFEDIKTAGTAPNLP